MIPDFWIDFLFYWSIGWAVYLTIIHVVLLFYTPPNWKGVNYIRSWFLWPLSAAILTVGVLLFSVVLVLKGLQKWLG